jgi:phage-related protein
MILYRIRFYEDRNGKKPVAEYLKALAAKNDKDSRIKLNKIRDYIKLLCEFGLQLGEPYVKHIEGEIYELRPIKDRILFAEFTGEEFILLSHFVKKTQKTPPREIEKAQRRLKESREE